MILLDGQEVVETLTRTIEETEGLFERLAESDSPKEQFFAKQEILWHQEMLREYIQEVLLMCEEEQAKFTKSLDKVLNPAMLKDLQIRLDQENLTNTTNFASFKEFVKELKADFLDKSTPQLTYLQSLLSELKSE